MGNLAELIPEEDLSAVVDKKSFLSFDVVEQWQSRVSDALGALGKYPHSPETRANAIENLGRREYLTVLQQIIWKTDIPMTREDFYEFPSIRLNMYGFFHWEGSIVAQAYQEQSFYKRFCRENPDLDRTLRMDHKQSDESSPEHLDRLYEAYMIMRGYEGITNYTLFR